MRVRGLKPILTVPTPSFVVSHPVRVRGLKLETWQARHDKRLVAPRAGAWIETSETRQALYLIVSHPVRVRGLKPRSVFGCTEKRMSHPVRVRGLKHVDSESKYRNPRSHPVRVRGLKHIVIDVKPKKIKSHPVRVRGLKRKAAEYPIAFTGRTPCGCVD